MARWGISITNPHKFLVTGADRSLCSVEVDEVFLNEALLLFGE
jgi:hypothetical protein